MSLTTKDIADVCQRCPSAHLLHILHGAIDIALVHARARAAQRRNDLATDGGCIWRRALSLQGRISLELLCGTGWNARSIQCKSSSV